jgi:hypothetical protein
VSTVEVFVFVLNALAAALLWAVAALVALDVSDGEEQAGCTFVFFVWGALCFTIVAALVWRGAL